MHIIMLSFGGKGFTWPSFNYFRAIKWNKIWCTCRRKKGDVNEFWQNTLEAETRL